MRIDPRIYWVHIVGQAGMATHLTITYLDSTQQFVVMEFYRKVWNTDDSRFLIPKSRTLTFQEELRIFGYGDAVGVGPREREYSLMEKHMKEA